MALGEIERLVRLLQRLPGLGPRSARRAVLHLLKQRESLMLPLTAALAEAAERVVACERCGNLDETSPCAICRDPGRERARLAVVEEVADLWALDRSGGFRGLYHVLGGTLSVIDGRGPEVLRIDQLVSRLSEEGTSEVILALSATAEGQTTAHYLAERLSESGVQVTRLGQGVPVGGSLDYLDDGTLVAALKARRPA